MFRGVDYEASPHRKDEKKKRVARSRGAFCLASLSTMVHRTYRNPKSKDLISSVF